MASVAPSDVTIVVPTRNRAATVFETVQYLRNELRWENPIILVDQSDDHGSSLKAMLESAELGGITHFYHDERGTSTGRNAGAKCVQTDWVFFLDDDVMPDPLYLQTVAEFITKNPWVDVIQPAVKPVDDWNEYRLAPEAWLRRYGDDSRERQPNPKNWDGVRWFQTRIPSAYDTSSVGLGTAFVISRRAFFGAGGFDETLIGLGDDRELAVRLWWYGYRIHQLPQAVGFHLRAAEGGTRTRVKKSPPRLLAKITKPVPAPGLIYVYLKWFPGYPTYCYYGYQLIPALKRPWVLPVWLLRLLIGIRQARTLMRIGPHYIDKYPPRARSHAIAE